VAKLHGQSAFHPYCVRVSCWLQLQTGTAPHNRVEACGDILIAWGNDNLGIRLLESGAYTADWDCCGSHCGAASGTWSLIDEHLRLTPSNVTGIMLEDLLRVFRVVRKEGKIVLDYNLADEVLRLEYPHGRFSIFHEVSPQVNANSSRML
jgi:hypothetical protein